VRGWEGVFVRDLGSKNGVKVAGEQIAGERRLRDGDRVNVGAVTLRVDDPEDRYPRQMEQQPALTADASRLRQGARQSRADSGVDLSHADMPGPVASPGELSPDASAVLERGVAPVRTGTHLPSAIAGLVLFAVVGLLVYLMFGL
jgi:FHA domain